MATVVLEDVSKTYGRDVFAVSALNMAVGDGELVVLVGPSGCGKTTTLRMIAGLEEPTSGTIRIGERVVNHLAPRERDVAMVFQNYALYPHMTAYRNMAFGLEMRGVPRDEIAARVATAAHLLGIEHLLDRRPRQLSGGERQRVALGRAIVRHPAVFLFDEPLSNLDARLRLEMRAELSRLHQELAATMIYVTHDQVEAMTLGDRIVVMNEGVAHQIAPPQEVYDRPADLFVAGFIGTPPMNFLRGTLEGDAEALAFRSGGICLPVPAARRAKLAAWSDVPLVLGIRPEDICVAADETQREVGTITALARVVEPLGDQRLVHFAVGNDSLVAKLAARASVRVGDRVPLRLRMDNAHFFEAATGKNITSASGPGV